jgi:dTDP-glucose 4,6-dehydratase
MKILLTGGVGFVGSNLTPTLLKNPLVSELTILDSLRPTANPEIISCFCNSPKFNFVNGDIRDSELVDNLVRDTDVVINLAGETHVDKSIADSKLFFEVNVLVCGVQDMLYTPATSFSSLGF